MFANVTAKPRFSPILDAQLDQASSLMTDGEGQYRILGPLFAQHETVNHGIGEYVRGDAHTNTVEGYFSILKRGIMGTYHHVSAAAFEAVSRASSISDTTSAPRSSVSGQPSAPPRPLRAWWASA